MRKKSKQHNDKLYFRGFCCACGKPLYSTERRDKNIVCEMLGCLECTKKALEMTKNFFGKNEEWANNLMYCDIFGFVVDEDEHLMLMDDLNNIAICPPDRFDVVYEWNTAYINKE